MKFEMGKLKRQSWQNGVTHRVGLALMTLVLLLAFALGANGLNADVIWVDELASVTLMGSFDPPYSLSQIVGSIRQYSPDQLPLYFFLGAGWAHLAGWSQFALRLISLLAGVLMIAWLYRFTSDTVNRRTAIVSVLLMATNVFALIFFHEIRGYTLLLLLTVVHTYYYCRLVSGARTSRQLWLFFVFSAIMMLYTHILGLVVLAGLGVTHIFMERGSGQSRAVIIGWALGILFFSPYLPVLLEGSFSYGKSQRALAASELVEPFWLLLANGFYILLVPLVPSLVYAVRRKQHPIILRMLLLAFFVGLTLLFANWRFDLIKLNRMRYFLLLWVPCMILLAYGLTSLPRWRAITALFLLLWGIAGYQFGQSTEILKYTGLISQARSFSPLHEYVYHLKDKPRSGDYLVGFSNSSVRVNKVHNRSSTADYYLKLQLGIDGVFLESHLMRYRLEHDMRKVLNGYAYILFAYNPADTPRNAVTALDIIREEFTFCAALVNKPDLLVQRYVHPILDCGREEYRSIHYDNGVRVVDRFARYVSGSEVLQILTGWEVPDGGLLDEYNVSMQIIASDWRNVRQEDRHLYEMPPWDVIELSTAGLSPGDYRLVMILYHRDSGEKVSGTDPTTGETANILPILSFTIAPTG